MALLVPRCENILIKVKKIEKLVQKEEKEKKNSNHFINMRKHYV